jgi:hypothetical protein
MARAEAYVTRRTGAHDGARGGRGGKRGSRVPGTGAPRLQEVCTRKSQREQSVWTQRVGVADARDFQRQGEPPRSEGAFAAADVSVSQTEAQEDDGQDLCWICETAPNPSSIMRSQNVTIVHAMYVHCACRRCTKSWTAR